MSRAESNMYVYNVFVFICGSSVNGNATAHAGYYTEENTASATAPTSVKETKVKASFTGVQNKSKSIQSVVLNNRAEF